MVSAIDERKDASTSEEHGDGTPGRAYAENRRSGRVVLDMEAEHLDEVAAVRVQQWQRTATRIAPVTALRDALSEFVRREHSVVANAGKLGFDLRQDAAEETDRLVPRWLIQGCLSDPLYKPEIEACLDRRLITGRPTDCRLPRTIDLVRNHQHERASPTTLPSLPGTTHGVGARLPDGSRNRDLQRVSAAAVKRRYGCKARRFKRKTPPVWLLV